VGFCAINTPQEASGNSGTSSSHDQTPDPSTESYILKCIYENLKKKRKRYTVVCGNLNYLKEKEKTK